MELKTMYPGQKDSPVATTSQELNSTDTKIYLRDMNVLPITLPYPLTIGVDKKSTEVVLVTEINENDQYLTIQRGSDKKAWSAGTKVARVFNASDLNNIQENIRKIGLQAEHTSSIFNTDFKSDFDDLKGDVQDPSSGLKKKVETLTTSISDLDNKIDSSLAETLTKERFPEVTKNVNISMSGDKLKLEKDIYNSQSESVISSTQEVDLGLLRTIGLTIDILSSNWVLSEEVYTNNGLQAAIEERITPTEDMNMIISFHEDNSDEVISYISKCKITAIYDGAWKLVSKVQPQANFKINILILP